MGALIPDWPHYQTLDGIQPDWDQIEAEIASDEVAGLILKATENMAIDSSFEAFRQNAEDRPTATYHLDAHAWCPGGTNIVGYVRIVYTIPPPA